MIVAVDLDVPIGFVLDDSGGGLGDAVQTPGLYSFGFGVVDVPRRIEGLGVGNDETKIALAMDIS